MTRLTAALMTLLLLSIGLPLCDVRAEEDVHLEAPATEAAERNDEAVERDEEGEGSDEGDSEQPTLIDTAHERISSGVLATATWLDSFFSDPRAESEISKTLVKVRFSVFTQEGDPVEYDVKANLRLDLPVLEDKLHLLIAGDPEDEDEDLQTLSGKAGELPEVTSVDNDFSTSLRYFLKQSLERNVSLRSGVKWRSGMPSVFLEPRYRQTVPLDSWLFRYTQRAIGFTDGRTGVRATFDLERELRKPFFFRSSADASWASDEDGYFYRLSFTVFQSISSRRVVSYRWANAFRTAPNNHLDNVVLSVRYRQRILRDWLFYEVVPEVSFPKDRNQHVTPGILLRLEMLFGYYPELPPPRK